MTAPLRTLVQFSFADSRGPVRDLLGEELGKNLPPIWGLNKEGEIRTAWRELNLPNVWYMMGTCLASSMNI